MNYKEISQGTQIYLSLSKRRYVLLVLEHQFYNNKYIEKETEEIDEINRGNKGNE